MRILTVPNWSFGRNRSLLNHFEDVLTARGVAIHYLRSDLDHNRTVSAFSGQLDQVEGALLELSEAAFDTIDLNHHIGVHPRIGALDVCPFIPWPDSPEEKDEAHAAALDLASRFGATISDRNDLPVFLYEESARPGHESQLPKLRKPGFGGLMEMDLDPDFGPHRVHPRLGVSVVGVRPFLVALNVNLEGEDPNPARSIAANLRKLRKEGDPRFEGVRAMGVPLAAQSLTQVSMNLTKPNRSPIDPIIEWVKIQAKGYKTNFIGTELIGVIRPRDMEHATLVYPQRNQIVDMD